MSQQSKQIEQLIGFVAQAAAPASQLVVPVSGGTDGALALWLCEQARPDHVVAVHCGRNLRASNWFERLSGVLYMQDIKPGLSDARLWAEIHEYCLAQKGYWPVGSKNRTEAEFGTYSRPSHVATFLPIVGVWKSDVMKLCQHIGVPQEILDSSRKPDAPCGRPAELSNIGIERIDAYLKEKLGLPVESGLSPLSPGERAILDERYTINRFKLTLPHRGPAV